MLIVIAARESAAMLENPADIFPRGFFLPKFPSSSDREGGEQEGCPGRREPRRNRAACLYRLASTRDKAEATRAGDELATRRRLPRTWY